jgi:hypothetical protein
MANSSIIHRFIQSFSHLTRRNKFSYNGYAFYPYAFRIDFETHMEWDWKSLCPVRTIGTLFPDYFIHDIIRCLHIFVCFDIEICFIVNCHATFHTHDLSASWIITVKSGNIFILPSVDCFWCRELLYLRLGHLIKLFCIQVFNPNPKIRNNFFHALHNKIFVRRLSFALCFKAISKFTQSLQIVKLYCREMAE